MLKKWIVGILVVGMVLMAGAGAFAAWDDGDMPTGTEVPVWEEDPVGTFTSIAAGLGAKAKLFYTGGHDYSCNRTTSVIQVSNHASVAQWVIIHLSGTHWNWFVRKPGVYVGNCVTAELTSNYDVLIDYNDFRDLAYVNPQGPYIPGDIATWYSFEYGAGNFPQDLVWIRAGTGAAGQMDDEDDLIKDSLLLHQKIVWKLWNKIEVLACHSACEYHDDATITVTLQGIKVWIDETDEHGNFKPYT